MKTKKIIQITKYMIKNWWTWEKKSFIYVFIRVPSIIIIPTLTSLIPKIIIDCIQQQASITRLVLVIGAFSSIIALLSWLSPYMYEKIAGSGQIIKKRYSVNLFRKTMRIKYSILESVSGRESLEKAKIFTQGYISPSAQFCDVLVMILVNFIGIITYLFVLYKINITIILLIISTCLIEGISLIIVEKFNSDSRNQQGKLYVIYNYFMRICHKSTYTKDVKLYNFKKLFLEFLDKTNEKHINILNKFTHQSNTISLFRGLLAMIREGIAYIYLTELVLSGNISISNFIFYFGIVTGFSSWLIGLSEQNKRLIFCSEVCSEYLDYMKLEECSDFKENVTNLFITNAPSIKFSNVSYFFETKKVLDCIDLKIKPGENIALVGNNGAGKTTLVKVLTNLYEDYIGEIYINDINIKEIENKQINSLISTVFQDFYFFPMSIAENIALCDKQLIDYDLLINCLKATNMYEKIIKLPQKLDTKIIPNISEEAIEFSGGEKQRLLISRALYKNSPILILDEPTAALDPIAESDLYNQYKELMQNKTTIFISHRLSSTKFCDKIVLLDDGKIIEVGTHDELMSLKGKYFEMYMAQSYYYQRKEVEK